MSRVNNLEVRQLPDFQTAYHWCLRFDRAPSGITLPAQINTICKSSTIPKREANSMSEIVLHTHKKRVPGVEFSAGEITLTFTDLVDHRIRNFIRQWRELAHENQTGVAVPYQDLYASISLIIQDRQGNDTYRYELLNCWCMDHDFGTELTDGSDTVYFDGVTMTISYDHFNEFAL